MRATCLRSMLLGIEPGERLPDRFASPMGCLYALKVDRTLAVTSQPPNQR
jgi:hypothetical protein